MAELYVKPGNPDRGWNDPPQFSYGLQQQRATADPQAAGAKRGPLSRRAAAAGEERPPPPPPPGPGRSSFVLFSERWFSPSFLLVPESADFSPAPPAFPPKSSGSAPSALLDSSLTTNALEVEEQCGVEDVLSPLNEALDSCRKFARKQVCDDISKRLVTLEQMWTQGKLTAPVRRGMRILTEELKGQHWDAADEIHRSLMVDHINEVSQWMVGVKRLIAETRKLPTVDLALEEQEVGTRLEPEHQ
ncbi:steroid receptor RNA activator 1 [Heteronotia binoei]|uniref:steroid receptor RNA activator 1 n=1 Tax=Heteronotia binoei TaxID=13085 RepID=UPI00292ED7B8|nr:steroid receptor RNA activator 1 [Heteronotia binoei]